MKTAGRVTWIYDSFIRKQKKKSEALGYNPAKWVLFSEFMLRMGFMVSVYDAKRTVSKYVRVHQGKKHFQVRFSNHMPNKDRELRGDCDFFVGVTHTGITRTIDAVKATLEYFGLDFANVPKNILEILGE